MKKKFLNQKDHGAKDDDGRTGQKSKLLNSVTTTETGYQTFLTFDYNVCSRTISSEWTIIFGQQNWEVLFDFKSTIHYLYCLFWCEKNNIPWEQCLGVKGCEILDIFIGSCFHPIWSHSPSIENIVKVWLTCKNEKKNYEFFVHCSIDF